MSARSIWDEYFTEPAANAPDAPWLSRVLAITTEWQDVAPAKRVWLLRDSRASRSSGVLPLGKVGQLIAEGGAGKTMALVQLALAVASGEPWLGSLMVSSPGRVLMVLGEEDAEEVRRRVYSASKSGKIKAPPGHVVALALSGIAAPMIEQGPRGPVDGAFLAWLRQYAIDNGPWSLIIVDPLSRFAGLEAETDNAAATRFIQGLESLAMATGATVLVAHHTNKTSRGGADVTTASARGSSALTDGVRWVATLSSERLDTEDESLREIVTASFTKSNYGRRAEPILLRRDLAHGGALVALDEVDAQRVGDLRKRLDPGESRRQERAARMAENANEIERRKNDAVARRAASDQALARERAAAVASIVAERPGIGDLDLYHELRARLGSIGRDSARSAIIRATLDGTVGVVDGAHGKRLHYPNIQSTTGKT